MDRRNRSRSRSRERRDRGRSRSPERPRDRDRDRESRDSRVVVDRRTSDRDRDTRDRDTRGRDWTRSKEIAASSSSGKDKLSIEQLRKERLALVKQLTQSDDEPKQDNGIITLKSKSKSGTSNKSNPATSNVDDIDGEAIEEDGEEEDDYNEEDVMAIMGFTGFNTTKDKPHEENYHSAAAGAVSKHKERKYRQYMNRKGGFNRPLQHMG